MFEKSWSKKVITLLQNLGSTNVDGFSYTEKRYKGAGLKYIIAKDKIICELIQFE